MMIKIKINRVYCIVSKKILSNIKTVYFLGIPIYKKDLISEYPIPEGFDIVNGRLVRVEPWPESGREAGGTAKLRNKDL